MVNNIACHAMTLRIGESFLREKKSVQNIYK